MRVNRTEIRSVAAALAIACLGSTAWVGESAAWEQRRGTVSFGLQGGVTSVEGSAVYTRHGFETVDYDYRLDNYRWGPAMGVHLRYGLDRSHAAGVSFEDVRYRRKSGVDRSVAKEFQANTVFFDYYLYLARRERVTPCLILGVGFHRDAFRFGRSDNLIPPVGLAANLGAGLEYFLRPAFSIDATLRGYYLGARGSGEWTVDGSGSVAASLQVGFQYYLLQ